jgi:hypothetical protein
MILGIAGLINSGKDTVAQYLVDQHNYTRQSWAGSVKDAVASIFGWDRSLLEGHTEQSRMWRETVDPWWARRLNIPQLSPRYVLRHFATDLLRDNFHQDIWIASLEHKLVSSRGDVVISDCRFQNELDTIRRLGGVCIRVVRDSDPPWVELARNDFNKFREAYPQIHPSEYSSVGLCYDYVLENNGTLEQLYSNINDLLLNLPVSR